MKKTLDYISITIFFAFVSLLGICSVFVREESFDTESVSGVSEAVELADSYVESNFTMSDRWDTLYARAALFLGQREFDGIYYDEENDRLTEIFSAYDESIATDMVYALNGFYKLHSDKQMYAVIVPDASGIYQSDMPDSLNALDEQTLIDELYYEINENITPIDVYSALYSARDSYIYFKTDSRWTQTGAYEAYTACADIMGFETYAISNYDIDYTHTSFYGNLSSHTSIKETSADSINVYRSKYGSYVKSVSLLTGANKYEESSMYARSALDSDDKYSYFLGSSSCKSTVIETTNVDSPSLLIIGCDYANCMAIFFALHYSKIVIVNPFVFGESECVSDIADAEDFDTVLFLCDIQDFCSSEAVGKIK